MTGMREISLLPPEILASRQLRRKQKRFLLAGGVSLLCFFILYGTLVFLTRQELARTNDLRTQRIEVEKEIAAYGEYVKMQAQVAGAGTLLQRAMGAPPDWVKLLTGATRQLPPDAWLSEITAAARPKEAAKIKPPASQEAASGQANQKTDTEALTEAGEITLRGLALDHGAVARWIEEIRQLPGLADVRCQYSVEEGSQEKTLFKFEVKAAVLPGNPYGVPPGKGN